MEVPKLRLNMESYKLKGDQTVKAPNIKVNAKPGNNDSMEAPNLAAGTYIRQSMTGQMAGIPALQIPLDFLKAYVPASGRTLQNSNEGSVDASVNESKLGSSIRRSTMGVPDMMVAPKLNLRASVVQRGEAEDRLPPRSAS